MLTPELRMELKQKLDSLVSVCRTDFKAGVVLALWRLPRRRIRGAPASSCGSCGMSARCRGLGAPCGGRKAESARQQPAL